MIKTLAVLLTAAGVFAVSNTAYAAHGQDIDRRQKEQTELIEAGRDDGRITYQEGRKLRRELEDIDKLEEIFRKSDNWLNPFEQRILHRLLDMADQHIQHQINDNYRRWSVLPRVGK